MNGREALRQVFHSAVAAARGDLLLRAHAALDGDRWSYQHGEVTHSVLLPPAASGGRILVVGAGKAAAALALGLEGTLGARIDRGAIVVKTGHAVPLQRIRVFEAAHPVPDQAGVQATREILDLCGTLTPRDLVFVLLTGGASALLVAPAAGLTLLDKAATHAALLRSGADIEAMNIVRKHLSAVKGGQLLRHLGGARVVTLAISDVPGDDPAIIASGPTVADPSTFADALAVLARHRLTEQIPPAAVNYLRRGAAGLAPETPKPDSPSLLAAPWIIASNRLAMNAAAERGRQLGLQVLEYPAPLQGATHAAVRDFASYLRTRVGQVARGRPLLVLAGGETTLQVSGAGLGGRCQEFALLSAQSLQDLGAFHLLAAGTDGTDGPTPAAGAFVDDQTLQRAAQLGMDPAQYLGRNDSHRFFEALHDLFVTGPTGTNVMDIVAAVVE